jgi:hypothetical protein
MTDTHGPRLWNARDLAPARPTRFVRVTDAEPETFKLALTIHCPNCAAKPHEPDRVLRRDRWASRNPCPESTATTT